MFSPTLLSKIHELTNNSSVETFVIVGAQADSSSIDVGVGQYAI